MRSRRPRCQRASSDPPPARSADDMRRRRADHPDLLERDERSRRAEPVGGDDRSAPSGSTACLTTPARAASGSRDRAQRALPSPRSPRRSDRRSRESESPLRRGTRRRTARGRTAASSPPGARARRCTTAAPFVRRRCARARRPRRVGSPAMTWTRRRRARRRAPAPNDDRAGGGPGSELLRELLGENAAHDDRPDVGGSTPSRTVCADAPQLADGSPRHRRFLTACLARAHRGRGCSEARR